MSAIFESQLHESMELNWQEAYAVLSTKVKGAKLSTEAMLTSSLALFQVRIKLSKKPTDMLPSQ